MGNNCNNLCRHLFRYSFHYQETKVLKQKDRPCANRNGQRNCPPAKGSEIMYGDGSIIFEKGRNKYCYDYFDNNGKRHRKRFDSEKEAKAFKKEIRTERDKGNLTTSKLTIGTWVLEFLETYQKSRLRTTSFIRQKQSAKKLKPISDIPIDQLSGTDIQKLYNDLSSSISSSSISKVHKLLFAAYKKAVALRMVQYNPMQAVEPVKVKCTEMSVFSFGELIRIFRVLRTNRYYQKYYTLFYLLLVLGCRIGELLALKWTDIDFTKREICIQRSKASGTGQVFHDPKTKAGTRYIPVVYDACINRLKVLQGDKSSGYVFCTSSGNALNYGNVRRAWVKICELSDVDKNIHTFRHTFATAALTKDIPILEVSRCLGHADANTTLKMYGHAMPGFNRHIIDLFRKKKTKSATKTDTKIL